MTKQTGRRYLGPRLYRRERARIILDTSTNMLRKLEKAGRLTAIRLGGRDVFYPASEVDAIANGER
jgi:predicted transcriptional regulator